jgi:hypothetical protein
MEVEYALTPEDFKAFAKHHESSVKPNQRQKKGKTALLESQTTAPRKPSKWVWVFVTLFVLIGLYLQYENPQPVRLDLILAFLTGLFAGCALLVGGVFALVYFRVIKTNFTRTLEDEHGQWIYEPEQLAITREGITVTSPYVRAFRVWAIVWKIDLDEAHLFFYITWNSAIIVPKRAFRDDQHIEEFVALCCQYQKGPTNTGIVTSLPGDGTAIFRPDKE